MSTIYLEDQLLKQFCTLVSMLVCAIALCAVTQTEPMKEQLELHPKQLSNTIADDSESTRRTIRFAGRDWNVKNGTGLGPGPNSWSDSDQSVWVDANGRLHLKIRNVNGVWNCAQVKSVLPTMYGMHRFYLEGRIDSLDKWVVAAPFLYKNDTQEIDIEFSKWGSATAPYGNFTVQPSNASTHHTFPIALNGSLSTHYFDWESSGILFKSIHGHYAEPPSAPYLIHSWSYTGSANPPQSAGPYIAINLWLYQGHAPSNGQEVELIVSAIEYPIATPQNLVITKSPGVFQLNWNTSTLANSYHVYASNQPDSGFQLLSSLTSNQLTVTDLILISHGLNLSHVFFRVTGSQ